MSKIIIHIGTHKTGTTSIQELFFKNRDLLAKGKIIFPDIGRSYGHHSLVTEWINMHKHYRMPVRPKQVWSDLVDEYADQDKTIFLTSEEFSRLTPKSVNMAQLRERVSKFDEIEVVCVLRNQLSFVQSVYTQICKNRRVGGLVEFIHKALNQRMLDGLAVDYNKLYNHVLTGFNADEIRLVSYESLVQAEDGLIGEFLKIMGTDLHSSALENASKDRANTSPEPLALWLANTASTPQIVKPPLLEAANKVLIKEFGDGVKTTIFSPEEVVKFADVFEPLNRTLEKAVAKHQPDFTIAPVKIDPNYIHRNAIGKNFWCNFSREIFKMYSTLETENSALETEKPK